MKTISGTVVDVVNRRMFPGTVAIDGGAIVSIEETAERCPGFIMPGFIDAHIHIESTMLPPSEFARVAVVHGTVATVSDPHEIANVLGVRGVDFMIADGKKTPFKFHFCAPSCVPATPFETNGATLGVAEVRRLLARKDILCLGEMMNFPGVLAGDPVVMGKIRAANAAGKRIDGHAPGLRGADAKRYCRAGITTDHECVTLEEAEWKISCGMKIQIREGGAARNLDRLFPLIDRHPGSCMFCADDLHPDQLLGGHIDAMARRAVARGADIFNVLRCACVNPVDHYKLGVGLLRPGDPADCIVVDSLRDFRVREAYIDGELVARNGKTLLKRVRTGTPNAFRAKPKTAADFRMRNTINVMVAEEGQIVDERQLVSIREVLAHDIEMDPRSNILRIVVVNRYRDALPAIGFVKNFGLRHGAIASSVAHDSHNIVAVGVDSRMISKAVNCIIRRRGGICFVDERSEHVLPLPIAGLMSTMDCRRVADRYARIEALARRAGSRLHAPFMTLSFMALPVVPELKITDRGLFDVKKFTFVSLINDDDRGSTA